jgi:DNA-binding NarL/FixJ family response regulator
LLADGLRADDIADHLGIATTTVYEYVRQASSGPASTRATNS